MSDHSATGDTPAPVAWLLGNPATLLVARICVTLPFLAAGIVKLADWPGGVAEMVRAGLHPGWFFNAAALVTELGGSALIIFDRKAWLGAGALGIFTVIATLVGHRFWDATGDERIIQFNTFLEHATIGAAFILVVAVKLPAAARTATDTRRQKGTRLCD
jgi:transmembrane protein